MTETATRKYLVKRDNQRDLRITGEQLATASSHHYQGDRQNRWTELELYKTESGKYVIATIGRTCWQGESDYHTAVICDTEQEVIRALENDEHSEGLGWLAKELLDEAGIDHAEEL